MHGIFDGGIFSRCFDHNCLLSQGSSNPTEYLKLFANGTDVAGRYDSGKHLHKKNQCEED
jgi:hypothetical protein